MNSPSHSKLSRQCTHRFYLISSIILFVLTFIGFRLFYLEGKAFPGRELTPPIRSLLITHGITMTAWILLSVTQPLLVTLGKQPQHKLFGRIGAVLALIIFIVGWQLAIGATKVTPPQLIRFGLNPQQFMAVPALGVTAFAAFVAAGVWYRRRPEIHRPLMLMATLSGVSAALGRIPVLNFWFAGTTWEYLFSAFFSSALVGVLLIGSHFIITRRVDRGLSLVFGIFLVVCMAISVIARTGPWLHFVNALTA